MISCLINPFMREADIIYFDNGFYKITASVMKGLNYLPHLL